jgi:hypothetical protein
MGRVTKGCLALAAMAALGTTVHAADPSYDELKQQVDQLKARLDQVEARSAVTPQQVDQTVERVLKDADQRSQMLQMEGFTAGWTKDKGFRIQDAAGNWALHPYFQFQFRSTTNWRNDGKHAGNDADWENGFSIPRMKIGFDGNAFSPSLTYNFLWNTSTTTGGLNLEQAWLKYMLADGWYVRAGQIINPAFHEQSMGSRYLMAADRSLVNSLITGVNEGRTQAVTVIYDQKGSPLWAEAGIEDGFNSQNTDFRDPNEGGTNDWGVTGRVNYFVNGDASEYGNFSAQGNKNDLLVIGAGGDITQTGDLTNYLHTVDLQWENTQGLGLYVAFLGNYIDNKQTDDTSYNWGFLVQGNYMLNDRWEVFGRYDMTKFDGNIVPAGQGEEFCELTGGFNWYAFGGYSAKITVDLTWLPNGVPAAVDTSNLGFLTGGDDQFVLRAQFQLLL